MAGLRPLLLALGLVVGWAWPPQMLAGQEAPEFRILAAVDYLAGKDLYLAVGTEHGVLPADTLPVYDGDGEGSDLLGFLIVVSATGKRSVANVLGEAFSLERGALIYLGVPEARVKESPGDPHVGPGAEGDVVAADPGHGGETRAPESLPEFHGRVSLDYDAYRTVTRWGDDPGAESTRTFSTPTFRLQARGRDLPGGFKLGTGLRISHRMSSDRIVQPVTSIRAYQFDLEKRFDRFPLEFHLGRFNSPFEEFSGFLDGLLLRVGPEKVGAGVALGFEPEWSNEGFSSQRPKMSGFLDFDLRGEALGYSGALSFLGIRPQNGLPDRTSLGLSQRVRVGRTWVHQRLQVDRDPTGSNWNVTRIQVDGSMTLVGGLGAFAGWRQWRSVPLWDGTATLGPRESRGHVGFSYWAPVGGGSLDMSLNRPHAGESGRTISGSVHLFKTPIRGLGIGSSASYWSRGDDASLLLSPEFRISIGSLSLRGSHRIYQTKTSYGDVSTHFSDLSLTFPLGSGTHLRLQGSTQSGGGLSSARFFASFWKGF